MCVARYASYCFSKGAICVPLDDQEKKFTLSSHRATRELYAKLPSHRAPVRALCEGSMRIELRSELYEKGALCGPTGRIHHFCIKRSGGWVWLLASPVLITFVLGTSNKGQGGLVTSFSIIDYLYTGNQQLNAKMVSRENTPRGHSRTKSLF